MSLITLIHSKKAFPALFSLLSFTLPGCTDSSEVKATIALARSTLSHHPDSALFLLRSIHPDKIHRARLKAAHSLLHSIALDKNFIDLRSDSIIRPAMEYYKKKGTPEEKAQTLYYLGRIYWNDKDPDNALKTLTEAEVHALQTDNPELCGFIYNALGNLYSSQENFPEAIEMYRKSEASFTQAGDLRKKANAFSYLGKVMRLEKELDSSVFYYQ